MYSIIFFGSVIMHCYATLAGYVPTTSNTASRGRTPVVYAVLPLNDSAASAIKSQKTSAAPLSTLQASMLQQRTGIVNVYFSQQLETPNNLDLFIVSSVSAASSVQLQLTSGFLYNIARPYLTGAVTAKIINFVPDSSLSTLSSAPVTEVAKFWLPPNANSTQIADFNAAFAKLKTAVQQASGEIYVDSGSVVGQVPNPSGQESQSVVALVGWQSVAAHEAFTTTASFGNAISQLLPYISGSTDYHDSLVKII